MAATSAVRNSTFNIANSAFRCPMQWADFARDGHVSCHGKFGAGVEGFKPEPFLSTTNGHE